MTDLKRLQNGLNRLDMDEIRKAMDFYGECACEEMTGLRCKVCGAWTCGACYADHQRWHSEDDPRDQQQ